MVALIAHREVKEHEIYFIFENMHTSSFGLIMIMNYYYMLCRERQMKNCRSEEACALLSKHTQKMHALNRYVGRQMVFIMKKKTHSKHTHHHNINTIFNR